MGHEHSGEACGCGVISFLVGGLIGAGLGLLLAPKSGREMRDQIKGMAEGMKETTEDYYERVKKTVVSALENGQEMFEEKKDLITSAVKAGIETYEKKRKKEEKGPTGDVEPSPYG
jgi:gas vesicle protein